MHECLHLKISKILIGSGLYINPPFLLIIFNSKTHTNDPIAHKFTFWLVIQLCFSVASTLSTLFLCC